MFFIKTCQSEKIPLMLLAALPQSHYAKKANNFFIPQET